MAAITSQGGSKAANESDWTPLVGRSVTIWPDNDQTGAEYAREAARLMTGAGAASVRIVAVPSNWPKAWDVSDPLPEDVTPETLAELLATAEALSDAVDAD